LLLLVATVFVMAPANLIIELFKSTEGLHNIFKILSKIDLIYIVAAIFVYNFLTTLLPVDKVLGKIYPYFGALLIFTAAAILFSVLFLFPELPKPELNLRNMHPEGMPIFPLLFLVLSCGAISGFHATQIPIVSRTLENEGHARTVFYGMMIGEGIIALIWAFATLTLLDGNTLLALIEQGTPSLVVSEIAITTLGAVLGTIAIVGVISLPLTSGATAFRAIRLMLAEYCRINQTAKIRRILITIPAFILSMILCTINFQMLWQYFSWANQILATLTLWICTIYLVKIGKPCYYAFLPALFMSFVVITYIIYSPIGFNLNIDVSKVAGFLITLCIAIAFLLGKKRIVKENIE
jgi:carbon starvation protein CstA